MRFYFVVVSVLCAAKFNLVLSQPYRLPSSLKPIRYKLNMEPNLEEGVFNGSVTIDLMAVENTKNITFHIRNIKIDENSITVIKDVEETEITVLETSSDNSSEICTIFLENELRENEYYSLTIGNFSGSLLVKTRKVGFYLAFYEDENGDKRQLAVTDFEPADARQAFPCFDEPALKARFLVSIIRQKDYSSLSNGELERTEYLGNDRYQDTFRETPEMSTYLVAFVVSDFKYTKVSKIHRIFARPEAIAKDKFSYTMEISVQVLRALEDFTGINFNMTKMDQLALPNSQFTAVAMENWGLVMYRESYLSCTNSSSLTDIQKCTRVISHEFSHQWFGNLVTAAWWDYLWLNEGFASYIEYYIADVIKPSWRFMDQFVVDELHISLNYDYGNVTNVTLYYQVPFPNASSRFIAYNKGSSIIRMMEHFLTRSVFRKGLNIYLENRKFKSAVSYDLYNALQEAVDDAGANHLLGNLSVADILETWTNNLGYPVINVVRNYETGDLTFEQMKFDAKFMIGQGNETFWHIPVNYLFQSDDKEKKSKTSADFWLSQKNITINNNFTIDGWFLVNIQQTGYYRVNYDMENWSRLITFLKSDDFEAIPVVNRAQLVNDVIHLAKVQQLPCDVALNLTDYLPREKDYIPITAFINSRYGMVDCFERTYNESKLEKLLFLQNFSLPNNLSSRRIAYKILTEYAKYILGEIYERLGIDETPNDTYSDKLSRDSVARLLCNSHHTKCREDVLKKFKQLKEDNSTYISPGLLGTVFREGVTTEGGKKFLKQLYLQNKDDTLRDAVNEGLTFYQHQVQSAKKLLLKFMLLQRMPLIKDIKFNWLKLL